MNSKVIAESVRLASSRLKKITSERAELSEKIAKLEKSLEEAEKNARAKDIAMKLVLDEDSIGNISQKQAELLNHDLKQVELALNLGVLKKESSIGTGVSEGSTSRTGDALIDYLTEWANSKK